MQIDIIALLPFAFTFLVGFACGYYVNERLPITKGRLRVAVAVVITFVWTIAVFTEIMVGPYVVSPLLHGIMGALVGWLFTAGKKKDIANVLTGGKE